MNAVSTIADLSTTPSSAGVFLDVQSDDLASFPSDWYHADHAVLYPFQQQQQLQLLHLEAQQFQQMAQNEPFQQLTAASNNSSRSSGFHCPICLRVSAQAPIRQACGHALCLQCTQQAISMLGSCPLCRTQLIFGGNKNNTSSNSNSSGRSLTGGGVEAMDHGFPANEVSFGQVG